MTALFLCNSPHDGGAEIWVRLAALSLRDRGHGIVLAAPAEGMLARVAREHDVPFLPLDAGPVLNRRGALRFCLGWPLHRRRVRGVVERARADHGARVVHVGLTAEKLLLGVGSALPVVWTEHGPLPPLLLRSPLMRPYREAARSAAVVHCVSDATASHFRGLGFPPDRIRTVRIGIPFVPGSAGEGRRLRAALGFRDDHVVIGIVCRLVWVKGVDVFLDVAARVAAEVAGARFLVVGDGPLRPSLEARAAALGLGDRVAFTGHRRDVPDLLQVMDIHLAPSISEGLPMAVLEAMHAGVPSVATAVGGHPELIVDGRTGFLVPAGAVDGMTARVVRLAREPGLRASLGSAARERARTEFDHDTFVDRIEAILGDAAALPTMAGAPA